MLVIHFLSISGHDRLQTFRRELLPSTEQRPKMAALREASVAWFVTYTLNEARCHAIRMHRRGRDVCCTKGFKCWVNS
jgi:hypothetical protein